MKVRLYNPQVKPIHAAAIAEEQDIEWVLSMIQQADKMGLIASISVILNDGSSVDVDYKG